MHIHKYKYDLMWHILAIEYFKIYLDYKPNIIRKH
jgi:hypothetical protein